MCNVGGTKKNGALKKQIILLYTKLPIDCPMIVQIFF